MKDTGTDAASKLESLYYLAENYEHIDEKEINPSLHALSSVKQRYQSPVLEASGGMKDIYKVYDARSRRYLAMAVPHADAPIELYDPLIHEAWLTAMLDHPNIITIHDIGINDQERPYFTMDLKTGQTLQDLIEKLRQGDRKTLIRYPLESLLQIFLKVCDAISYAHSVNVLHLDLKPANIQVGEFGEVLVCDWGMGKVLGHEGGIELDRRMLNPDLLGLNPLFGQVKGTPGYMAPEQVEKNSECSVQTDIYGLGCILYSILTLHCPVEGEVEDALRKTVEGEILSPALRTPGRNIPKSLNAVVLKATAIKPAYRYESVAVFRKEVHRFLTGFATQAENAGVLTQFALFYSRNRRFCLTILTSLLILLGGLSWSFWILNTKEHAASEARHMAEQTLRLYQAGQSELEQMSFQTAASVVKYVEQRHLQTDERGALSLLQAALENEPDNPVYLRALGQYWFIQHRFDLAVTYFDRGIHPEDEIHNIARFYAGLNLEGRRLSAEQMVDVLRRLNGHEDLELMMIVNDQKQRVNLRERALIIEEYLHTINPDWEEGWFEFDAEKSSLRIGGRNLRKLANSRSVLVGLQPRMLDISGSDIEQMWRETGYAIETLNACDVEFTELYFLTRFVHLKKLIVRQGQLSAKEWSIVPEWVRVIEQ